MIAASLLVMFGLILMTTSRAFSPSQPRNEEREVNDIPRFFSLWGTIESIAIDHDITGHKITAVIADDTGCLVRVTIMDINMIRMLKNLDTNTRFRFHGHSIDGIRKITYIEPL